MLIRQSPSSSFVIRIPTARDSNNRFLLPSGLLCVNGETK
jgi:hypothetical protein